MAQNPDAVREAVRKRYAAKAKSALRQPFDPLTGANGLRALAQDNASCCSDTNCCESESSFYPETLLSDLPDDVASFSLGCGDPITLASLQPGETVLDLGSGGGLDCFLAAKKVGEKGHVIGVDMTPEMIERASARRINMTNVEFRQGYLEDMPIEDNSVDVVISNCVINLSPDKPQVFREIYRALKPGGRVAVSDIVTNGPLPKILQKSVEAWGACVAGALDVKDYTGGLLATGFTDVKVQPKESADTLLGALPLNKLFSATITARKPNDRSERANSQVVQAI